MTDYSDIMELGRQLASVALRVLEHDNVTFKAVPEDEAPDTLGRLLVSWTVSEAREITVSADHSERTVYGTPEGNHAFRAWHDWAHIRGRFDFTPEGEYQAYLMQCDDIRRVFGATTSVAALKTLLWAEVVGQVEYEQRHGRFPADQIAFSAALFRAVSQEF